MLYRIFYYLHIPHLPFTGYTANAHTLDTVLITTCFIYANASAVQPGILAIQQTRRPTSKHPGSCTFRATIQNYRYPTVTEPLFPNTCSGLPDHLHDVDQNPTATGTKKRNKAANNCHAHQITGNSNAMPENT